MLIQELSNGDTIYQTDEEVEFLYLIKCGGVKIYDRDYNYLYNLEEGSYFGDIEIIYNLYSDVTYKGDSTHTCTETNNSHCVLYKVDAVKFQ